MTADTQVALEQEQTWLATAIDLATESVRNGGGPFGALVVKDGDIVATGNNLVTTNLDPTAHAEVSAIRNACKALGEFALPGCTLVTSCEPCPMCLTSSFWARLDRIVFAADRDDAATAGFDDRAFYDLFAVTAQSALPTRIDRVPMVNRTQPFDLWLAKPDRIDY